MTILQIPTARVFEPLLEPARYKGAHGGRGCVHPDTPIDTPSGQIKIKDFSGGDVYSWLNGRRVIAKATQPYSCTEEDLYKVKLKNGSSIIVTDEHKFLTNRGWVELRDLSMSDEVACERGQAPSSLPRTSSGSVLLESLVGVQHLMRTLVDYLGGYSLYPHQYDPQPLQVIGSAQSSPQPLNGEQQRMTHALTRLDALESFGTDSPSLAFRHASSRASAPSLGRQYYEALGNCIDEIYSARHLQSFRSHLQSLYCRAQKLLAPSLSRLCLAPYSQKGQAQILQKLSSKLQHASFDTPVLDQSYGSLSDVELDFDYIGIELIRKHSRQAYWDLHVFGTNNYLSNGIVNHNSGKSHFFGEHLIEESMIHKGLLSVCIREVQKSLKDSAYRLLCGKLQALGLGEKDGFKVFKDRIETPGDGVIIFQGMQDHTAESIKSLEGFMRAWFEEAQTMSAVSLRLLRPTIRAEGSELWFSWNPRRKTDPVDVMLRQGEVPTGAVVVNANWSDNPWFPDTLGQERLDCLRDDPDQYEHIWEGDYVSVSSGAYFAKHIADARREGRIGKVGPDPLMTIKLFVDIGGTGAKADAFSIWVAQFIGKEIRAIDYYESVGQPLDAHVAWLRERGYTPDRAQFYLPHDGKTHDRVYDVSYESALKQTGYKVEVIPNQGKGAAMARIESARRVFPNVWIDAEKCKGGIDSLSWYHEKKDTIRGIGLGPEHDFASHGADAWGLMCIVNERPQPKWGKINYPKVDIV